LDVLLLWGIAQAAVIAVPLLVLYMAWRFLRAYERRQRPSLDDSTQARLVQLEASILRIDSELTALGEEQRFPTQLLDPTTQFGTRALTNAEADK
jgi:hypothetical protein